MSPVIAKLIGLGLAIAEGAAIAENRKKTRIKKSPFVLKLFINTSCSNAGFMVPDALYCWQF
jgi:hypothetical protein